jgi:uncharacterized membrane protein YdjX (TVP38/TMEM64 family)
MVANDSGETGGEPRRWTRYLPITVIAILIVAVIASGGVNFETVVAYRDSLQGWADRYGPLAVLAYAAVYVTGVALSVPGAVFLTILGGFLFGWLFGGTIAWLSATLGAVLVFLIARTSIGDVLARKAGPRLQNLAEGFRRDAFSYLLFLRFLPIMPFWLTNLAPALLGVPARTFALASLIGLVPATFTFAGIGASLETLIAGQKAELEQCVASGAVNCSFEPSVWALLQPQHIAAFAALGVLSLVPVLVRRWRRHAEPAHSGPAQERAP